jgi:ubiquinone/menaquinone biosynthesis C-methylase UbiE
MTSVSRPAQIDFLSRFAGAYDPVVALLGFPRLWRAMANCAAPAPAETALDVCTGTGGVALELARRGARVLALDLGAGMLRRALQKRSANACAGVEARFVRMDARRLAFPDRAFPLVTCAMALHEMAETERGRVLDEIRRVACGRVIVAEYRVPAPGAARLAFRAAHVYEYWESDDFASFVERDFGDRLAAAALAVDAVRDVGAYRVWVCRV